MKTIEEGLVDAHNQVLESSTPGNQALADIQADQARVKQEAQFAEAQKNWQKANAPVKDYNYRAAHCTGVDLIKGELPNEFYEPGTQNVAGFDMSNARKVKSVVDRDHEENAFYGVKKLSRSKTKIDGTRPQEDIIGLSSVAAALQAGNATFEDFERVLPGWDPGQRQRAWAAGSDSLRHSPVEKRLVSGSYVWTDFGPMISVHPAQPTSLDFDVRMADKEFQQAGRQLYQHWTGEKFNDTDAEASRWLANHLRNLDFNTPYAAAIMLKGKNATWETHQSYVKAIEAWNLTNMERRLLPQLMNAGRMLADPVNLWGTPIAKLTVNTAARFAALDFFTRMMKTGALSGAVGGMAQATAQANVQAKDPTAGELATAAAGGAVAGEAIPLLLQEAGKAVKRAIGTLKRPDLPDLPPNNVEPKPTGSIYGEISLPNREGDMPVRTGGDPTMAEAEAGNLVHGQEPANLEQQPFEGPPGFTTDPGFPIPPQDQIDAAARAAGSRARDMLTDPAANENAAAALPSVARPALPQDVQSRLFIDPATGYYSPIQKAVVDAKSARQAPAQWIADMKRAPFFKQEEFEWLDFDKFFKGKDKVTKEELLAHIDNNLIKIERHNLVPQRRDTVPWEQAVARNNPEYEKLLFEAEAVENEIAEIAGAHHMASIYVETLGRDLDEALRVTNDLGPDDPRHAGVLDFLNEKRDALHKAVSDRDALEDVRAQHDQLVALQSHMKRIAAEERRALIESGAPPPPWVHGIEHMLTDPHNIEPREAVDNLFKALDSERTHQDLLTRARSPRVIAQLNDSIAADQRMVQEIWKELEGMAANMGALIHPRDIERIEGMARYGNPEVRDYSIVGSGMRGTRFTAAGVDPIGHQIALYRHPEGLKMEGTSGHPGGTTPGTVGWAITSERNLVDGKSLRVVDEGQTDWGKARRDNEMRFNEMKPAVDADQSLDFYGAAELREAADYDDYVWKTYLAGLAQGKPAEQRLAGRLPKSWAEATPAQRQSMVESDQIWTLFGGDPDSVLAIPKHIFHATAMSNIFKSELYNAAMDGKDYFGWVTSQVVQQRYNAEPQYLEGTLNLRIPENGSGLMVQFIGQQGYTQGRSKMLTLDEAYALADKIGGDNGSAIRKQAYELERLKTGDRGNASPDLEITLDKPVQIKAGSFLSYDVQTKKEMQKFVEKYGGKVEQKDMPVAPGSSETVKVWAIELTPALRKKLLERGVPIGAAAGAAVVAGQEEETQ